MDVLLIATAVTGHRASQKNGHPKGLQIEDPTSVKLGLILLI